MGLVGKTKQYELVIDKFLGLNQNGDTGDGKPGEWVEGVNAGVDDSDNLIKRSGIREWLKMEGGTSFDRIVLLTEEPFLGRHILKYGNSLYSIVLNKKKEADAQNASGVELDRQTLITKGALVHLGDFGGTNEQYSFCFVYDNMFYYLIEANLYGYNGTTMEIVTPYSPTIAIGCAPATGAGTNFEERSMLNSYIFMEFEGDGTNVFNLLDTNIDGDDLIVSINSIPTTAFTVNRSTGVVTFTTAPTANQNVRIGWKKDNRDNVIKMLSYQDHVKFGASTDSNVFLYNGITYRVSGIGQPTYWPVNSLYKCGDSSTYITGMVKQFETMMIFKSGSTHLVKPEVNPDFAKNPGLNPYIFPNFELNGEVGNEVSGTAQVLNNNPFSICNGSGWEWRPRGTLNDAKSAFDITDRISEFMETLRPSNISHRYITYNNTTKKELYIKHGAYKGFMVYNYNKDVFYHYNTGDPEDATVHNLELERFAEDGESTIFEERHMLYRMSDEYNSDLDGTKEIKVSATSSLIDFGNITVEKSMQDEIVSLAHFEKISACFKFPTNKKNSEESKKKCISQKSLNWDDIDFNDINFDANRQPLMKNLKIRANNFITCRWEVSQSSIDEQLALKQIVLKAREGKKL